MADVKTESLNTPNKSSSSTLINKMTVEKQASQANHPSTSKSRTIQSKGSHSSEAPSVTPAQQRMASGNNSPVSPKKIDSKVSPQGGSGIHGRSQSSKSKSNPWHKPSPPNASSGSGKGRQSTSPESKVAAEVPSTAVQVPESAVSSRSITIPKDQVSFTSRKYVYIYIYTFYFLHRLQKQFQTLAVGLR